MPHKRLCGCEESGPLIYATLRGSKLPPLEVNRGAKGKDVATTNLSNHRAGRQSECWDQRGQQTSFSQYH